MKKSQFFIKVQDTQNYYINQNTFCYTIEETLNGKLFKTYYDAYRCALYLFHSPCTLVNSSTLNNVLFISTIDIHLQRMKDARK